MLPLEGVPEFEEEVLVAVYQEELLIDMPVQILSLGNPKRESNALFLARKDIRRLIKALKKRGMVLKVEIPFESKKEG
jgi:hypothetical protein